LDNKQFPPQEGHEAGYTIEEFLAVMEPVFQRQKAAVEKCIAGLTVHAAGLAAKGQEAGVSELNRFISDMVEFWDPETAEQRVTAFEQTVAAARDSGKVPVLTGQDKADIRAGLALYAQELRTVDSELEYWASACEDFAEALEEQWRTEAAPSRQTGLSPQDADQFNMKFGGM